MAEAQDQCVSPARGPIRVLEPPASPSAQTESPEEVKRMTARVGKPAPDFEAPAYVDGGFKNIKLSDYRGKWVVVCFYPGDFTFV